MVVAVTLENEIGIDIEDTSKSIDMDLLKKKILTQSEQSHPITQEQLYMIWTVKEAFVKALGLGLHYPLHLIETCWDNQALKIKTIKDPSLHLKQVSLKVLPLWDTNFVGHVIVFGDVKEIFFHPIF